MESVLQGICFAIVLLLEVTHAHQVAQVFMTESPSSVTMPINDETILTCKMNISPDRFQWRHYPVTTEQAYNPNYHLVLAESRHVDLPMFMYKVENATSTLTLKITNTSLAGDYQCLAHYGAAVVASLPGRISIADVKPFPKQPSEDISVTVGNTVLWRCDIPESNPPAYIDYFKDKLFVNQDYMKRPTSLILANVSSGDSGIYTCSAFNNLKPPKFNSAALLKLNVVPRGPFSAPKFVVTPKSTYTAKRGLNIFMECAAIGTPAPTVVWRKVNGEMSKTRTKMELGGLSITDVTSSDAGEYICNFTNSEGSVVHRINLEYHEAPRVVTGPYITNVTSENIEEGEYIDMECDVTGSPKPVISWFLNGHLKHDRHIKTVGNHLQFRPLEKRHAGMIQCFASNIVGTDYGIFILQVTPKQISGSDITEFRRGKHRTKKPRGKPPKPIQPTEIHVIPPSKPTVTRNSDESVVVRWHVPTETGLPIKFFKVQYREVGTHSNPGSSAWITTNDDIVPNIRSFQVSGLKPGHVYKFRIAAVYSNDDNKLSPKSDAFHLHKLDFFARNPLPVPIITSTETVNSSAIRVFWDYTPTENITVDGFVVNYISASNAGDYNKAMVDGQHMRSFLITHLDPGTTYDIRLQSFTSKSASEFSSLMREKTAPILVETSTMATTKKPDPDLSSSNTYVLIGACSLILFLLTASVSLIVCKKWKKKKNENSAEIHGSKPEDLNHHIQMEGNDYVISPKMLPLSNGCVMSPNHMTIRANPLAEADSKNQNMIEMSCLSSQNNNCSTQPSVSSQEVHSSDSAKIKDKSIRHKSKDSTPGENYV